MTRVYGRVHFKNSEEPIKGAIIFEPRDLVFTKQKVLFAYPTYMRTLDDNGYFEVDIRPAKYFVHLHQAKLEVDVPMVNEVTLRELLQVRYQR